MSPEAGFVTSFLNVDLDLRVDDGLDVLIEGFGAAVIVLHKTPHEASLELGEEHRSLEETVLHFLDVIEALPAGPRNAWNRCEYRRLNVGIQAGRHPHATEFAISKEAISLVGKAQLDLVITVYSASAGSSSEAGA
jgi:hypothetical protein